MAIIDSNRLGACMKRRVLVLGAGKIGSLISCLLTDSGDYIVHLVDNNKDSLINFEGINKLNALQAHHLDTSKPEILSDLVKKYKIQAIISALPYHCNYTVSEVAAKNDIHYFDLTEDVDVALHVQQVCKNSKSAFVPQCGLAPGFISIVTNALMNKFDRLDSVAMRVGALPVNPNNTLKYSLTWSTDGLINEYGNPCYGIENGEITKLLPLEGYETITLDGLLYEAFNTSGGLGTLADTYAGKVNTMNYKTLRYPGHCEKIRLLMIELKLNENRKVLKEILENAVPQTKQDVVLIYVAVKGYINSVLFEENYVKKLYPQEILGETWSAIQVSTASGICCVVDMVFNAGNKFTGFIKQEEFILDDFLNNKFGKYYE